MSDLIIVAIIAGSFQLLAWVIQKLFDRRKQLSDSYKNKSETMKPTQHTIA